MKVLCGMALRQTTGFVESLLRLVGRGWTVPAFSTLSRRQKTLAVNIPYQGTKGPLHLLIDSTGTKVEGEGEWHARKHGGPKRRVWREIHLGIDDETVEVRAVEITGSHIGDAPVLPDLLNQIPAHERIGSVTADGACDTRKCHDALADRGTDAVIPPGTLRRRWIGYHRRRRAETKMHCMKLLGLRLMARDLDRQVAEVRIRIAVMNGHTALGIPVAEIVG
jgi:hypothetical protein